MIRKFLVNKQNSKSHSNVPEETVIPNVFIVGAQKCGTTAVFHYLSKHPDVFVSDPKEAKHFCVDIFKESDDFYGKPRFFTAFRNLNDYLSLFSGVKKKHVCVAPTLSLYSKAAAKKIYEFNTKAKVIIMIREPVSFLHSYHNQMYLNLQENEKDFSKALLLEEKRKEAKHLPHNVMFPSALYYRNVATFSEQISRYIDLFPQDNLFIRTLSDLKNNPQEFYHDLLTFLEVEDNPIDLKVINKSRSLRFRPLVSLMTKLRIGYLLKKLVGKRFYASLKKWFNTFFYVTQRRTALSEKKARELKLTFVDEVKKLETILQRDDLLDIWGYPLKSNEL